MLGLWTFWNKESDGHEYALQTLLGETERAETVSIWDELSNIGQLLKIGRLPTRQDADLFVLLATRGRALEQVFEAAKRASHEIQSQKTLWPGEVDDLADALAELEKNDQEGG